MLQDNFATHGRASFFLADPKRIRADRTRVRLHHAALDFIHASSVAASLGPDPLVEQMVAAKGLAGEVAVLRLVVRGQVFTAICVPTSVWRDDFARAGLMELKSEAASERTRCILVPQRWLRGKMRSTVARALAGSRNVRFTEAQVSRVLQLLARERITTLSACAGELADHKDPFGAVFSMCCIGILDIDRSHPIGSNSWISTLLSLPQQVPNAR